MSATAFDVRQVSFSYPGAEAPALDGVSIEVERGALYSVIGPNGSGKSTLLKVLLGALTPDAGDVRYADREITDWSRRNLARHIGVVPQGEEPAFPLGVREIVGMGRYPHMGLLRGESLEDREAIAEALRRCDVTEFADRPLSTLSGGERQRVLVARALAQRPETLVLDEPTVSLDIRHEMTIFELLAELASQDRVTVVLVTHHLNLAARYADRLLLLDRGTAVAEGRPNAVLTREMIEQVYDWPVAVSEHPGPGHDAGAPQITPLARRRETESESGSS